MPADYIAPGPRTTRQWSSRTSPGADPRTPPAGYDLPERFDARAAASRIALLALASLGPRCFEDGRAIDLAALLEDQDIDAFRLIVPADKKISALARSPANRLLHPGKGLMRAMLVQRARDTMAADAEDPVLASHAITPDAAAKLVQGEHGDVLEARGQVIVNTIAELGQRLAGWTRSDRPSIDYLLRQGEAEP